MVLFYKNPAFWQFKKRSVVDEYKKQRYTIEHTFYGRNPTFPLAKRYHDVSIKDAVVAMHIIEEKVAQRHHQRNRYHRYRHHH